MKTPITITLAAALFTGGCTHTTRITKGPELTPTAESAIAKVSLGITPIVGDPLLEAAVDRLQSHAAVSRAEENFKFNNGSAPDYVFTLERTNRFKASGQNFLITFPGFIVFTHAWLGYKYKAEVETTSTLMNANAEAISRRTIQTPFEFRHCSFARGAAAGLCGWVCPGYGGAAVIPGAIFAASYDKRATPEFMDNAKRTYGDHVAHEIMQQLLEAQRGVGSSQDTTLHAKPPVFLDDSTGENFEYNDQHYGVYVLRTDGRTDAEPEFRVVEVSETSAAMMDQMAKTHAMPELSDLNLLLADLGLDLGPEEPVQEINQVQISSMVDKDVIDLARPLVTIPATF